MRILFFLFIWVLFISFVVAQEPVQPNNEDPIRLKTHEAERPSAPLREEAPTSPPTSILADETADLKRRIEALELLLAEQSNRRVRMNKVVSAVEKSTVNTISYVQKKLGQGAPETDLECSYDYIVGRCVPVCDCKLQPKLGDYSLSRACRLVEMETIIDGNELAPPPCDASKISMTPWVVRLSKFIMHLINTVARYIHEHAPPSDEECKFKLLSFSCSPIEACEFSYQFGDYSLSRACRLRDGDGEGDAVLEEMGDPLKE